MSYSPKSISRSRSTTRYNKLVDDGHESPVSHSRSIHQRQHSSSTSNKPSIDPLLDTPIYARVQSQNLLPSSAIDILNGPALTKPIIQQRQLSTPTVPVKTNRLTELLKRAVTTSSSSDKENVTPNKVVRSKSIVDSKPVTPRIQTDLLTNSTIDKTYATDLNTINGLKCVMKYSADSHRVVKRVASLFNKLSAIQCKAAVEMEKAIEYETAKLQEQCAVYPYNSNLTVLCEQLHNMAATYHTYGTDISISACEPLNKLFTIGSEHVSENNDQVDKLLTEVNKMEQQLQHEQNDALQALNSLQQLYQQSVQLQSQPNNNNTKQLTQCNKLIDKQKLKTIELCDKYNTTVNYANNTVKPSIDNELNGMLVQLQCLEELRIHSYQSAVMQLCKLNIELKSNIVQCVSEIDHVFNTIDPNTIIQHQIHSAQQLLSTSSSDSIQATNIQWTYNVPITATQLKSADWQYALESLQASQATELFSMSLQQIISYPVHWGTTVQLPKLVSTLCTYIEQNTPCEGIYRISVEQKQLQSLKELIESGDYTLPSDTTSYTCAALLKQWLRDLATPLIPFALYTQCIEIGKLSTDTSIQHKLQQLWSLLPDLNKHILTYILQHIVRLQQHTQITRMNSEAYAIVLSPNLVRARTADPMTMLADTKYATIFTQRLLDNIHNLTTFDSHTSSSSDTFESLKSPTSSTEPDDFVSAISQQHVSINSSVVDELSELDSKYTVDFDKVDGSLFWIDNVTGQRHNTKPDDKHIHSNHTG